MVMKAWEISQAYKVFRGSVGSAQSRLNRHKNSDLGSEVGTVTGLNSTTHHLCYVLVERSARLERDGYDSVVWHVVLEASASDTR